MFSRIRFILIFLSSLLVMREVLPHSARTLDIEIPEERNGEIKNEFAPIQQELKTRLSCKSFVRQTESKTHQTYYKPPFIPSINITLSKMVLHCTFLI